MSKYHFSNAERYGVFTVHGESCYICREPVDLVTMEVDHVIPESLADNAKALAKVIRDHGLPDDFDVNTFENWMPACRKCNGRKRETVISPSVAIQIELQKAVDKAPEARKLAAEIVSQRKLSIAINALQCAHDQGKLTEEIEGKLKPLLSFYVAHREPEVAKTPIRLSPLVQVISEKGGVRIARGPYGIGGGPIGPNIHPSFECPNCGHSVWSGPRCMVCGEMSDD